MALGHGVDVRRIGLVVDDRRHRAGFIVIVVLHHDQEHMVQCRYAMPACGIPLSGSPQERANKQHQHRFLHDGHPLNCSVRAYRCRKAGIPSLHRRVEVQGLPRVPDWAPGCQLFATAGTDALTESGRSQPMIQQTKRARCRRRRRGRPGPPAAGVPHRRRRAPRRPACRR